MKKILFILLGLILYANSFSQEIDGVERNFYSYRLNLVDFADFSIFNDTTLDNFHNFLPQQKVNYNTLGYQNPGQPIMSAVFSQNTNNFPFFWLNNYAPFIKTHQNAIYFDTKKPISIFTFSGGTKKMTNTGFLHSQNLGNNFNFAFNYNVFNSDGQYMYNKAKVHALNFNTAFTKRKYQCHFDFIFNRIDHKDNGGLKDDFFESSELSPGNLVTNLNASNTKISQFGFNYNHELKFGHYENDTTITKKDTLVGKILKSRFSIMHDINFDKTYRLYTDNSNSFYGNYYEKNTHDSIGHLFLNNKFLLNLNIESTKKVKKFQVLAGLKNTWGKTCFPDTSIFKQNTTFLTGLILFESEKNKFFSEVNYALFGTKIFDLDVFANDKFLISNILNLNLYVNYLLKNPDVFYSYFSSNNFKWKNDDLSKINTLKTGLKVDFPKIYLKFGTNITMLQNYMIFGQDTLPQQITTANLIADIYAEKLFNFKHFHWLLSATYQLITDPKKLPLPNILGYSSFYFQRPLFKKAMIFQVGIDCKFSSAIYGYGYMPASGIFYLQTDKKFGNFPNLGAHVEAKIKRFRGFLKVTNITGLFMKRNYYLLYQIPDNPFAFNFGIAWEFYD